METGPIIAVTLIVGFGLGFGFARVARHRRGAFFLKILVTIFAVVAIIGALAGFIALVSPTLFMDLLSKLPMNVQQVLFTDLLFRGGTGFWSFLIVSGLLWWLRVVI